MWRTLHVLSPVQSLALASFSAASLALPLAVQSISRDQTALYLRNLFWPDTLYVDAYVNFSLFFIGVLPALLGYYHLGRLGFLLNVAAGFALAWIMAVCWILCLVHLGRHHFGSLWSSAVAYAACIILVYLLIAWLHLRAATSPSVRDAQRKLHLLPTGTLWLL